MDTKKRPIEISETTARELYKTAANELKVILEDTFGKEFFCVKITDRVKTYKDACVEIGETPVDEAKMLEVGFTMDEIAYRKIKTITKALNEGWTPNWSDSNQKKWGVWFDLSSGFTFYNADYRYSAAYAGNGSRLCFKSSELAEYAGKQFADIYGTFIS